MRRFLFRVDADARIGTGHLMRCLALADGLSAAGGECVFICRGDGLGSLGSSIRSAGHALIILPSLPEGTSGDDQALLKHSHWLPGGWAADAAACRAALGCEAVADWLVVDHYALDHRWHGAMRGCAEKTMVIDDLADRRHDCDLLLDQSLLDDMEQRYDGLVPAHCTRLLGPRFALLRDEFARAADARPRYGDAPPCLLVMFGGSDARGLTLRSVELLAAMGWRGRTEVVAGPLYAGLPALRAAVGRLADVRLHAPAENVAALMSVATLALGSPGTASWERCATALPSLSIAQAENQESIGLALGRAGAHLYLGRDESLSDEMLAAALRLFIENVPGRIAMSRAAFSICDGQGVRRVVRRLCPPRMIVVPACRGDAELLFAWRDHENNRRYSHDPRPLLLADHIAWVERTLGRADVDLLVVRRGARSVACVRFDRTETRARVSVYTDPELHGQGVGLPSLFAALDWLQAEHPEIVTTDADVLPGNVASQALFAAAGYRPAWARYERPQALACAR